MCVSNFLNPNSDPNTFEQDRVKAQRRKKMRMGWLITSVVLILAGGLGFGIWRLSFPEVFLNVDVILKLQIFFKNYFLSLIVLEIVFRP